MKIREKEFEIYKNERPKVLLLGNGLCRAYGGISWDGLLDEIKDNETFPRRASEYILPMPLKAAMLTNNSLAKKMRELVKRKGSQDSNEEKTRTDWSSFVKTTSEMRDCIRELIVGRFDYVLTTNYSYEIEAALLNEENLSENKIESLQNYYEVNNAQTKFMINTFNFASDYPVWHIHGEARKPDSMIIGNCYYGKLLRKCIERLDGISVIDEGKTRDFSGKAREFIHNKSKGKPQKIGSWIDAFVLGDVYILGLGMDFSEADLWWLIDYKKNHPEFSGKTYFYEAKTDQSGVCVGDENIECDKSKAFVSSKLCRNMLLREVYGVDTRNLGCTIKNAETDYKAFYAAAIAGILAEV